MVKFPEIVFPKWSFPEKLKLSPIANPKSLTYSSLSLINSPERLYTILFPETYS